MLLKHAHEGNRITSIPSSFFLRSPLQMTGSTRELILTPRFFSLHGSAPSLSKHFVLCSIRLNAEDSNTGSLTRWGAVCGWPPLNSLKLAPNYTLPLDGHQLSVIQQAFVNLLEHFPILMTEHHRLIFKQRNLFLIVLKTGKPKVKWPHPERFHLLVENVWSKAAHSKRGVTKRQTQGFSV